MIKNIGMRVVKKTKQFSRYCLCRYILASLALPFPWAGATKDPRTSEKLQPIEIRQIPVVSEPRPNAAKNFFSILPTTAALMSEYKGWNIIPTMGHREYLEISPIVLQVLCLIEACSEEG